MTTSGMSYGDRNGLQDQRKPPLHPPTKPPTKTASPTKSNKKDLPNVLVCFKSEKPANKVVPKKEEKKNTSVKRSKSRELRGGVLHVGCDCERRNGLQDSCPRMECQGAPECMTVPPTCPPSEFAQAKHIAKAVEKLQEARAEFIKQMSRTADGGNKKEESSNGKVNYDCIPLADMLKTGGPCPICDKPMDGCGGQPTQEQVVVVDVPVPDCSCCPMTR